MAKSAPLIAYTVQQFPGLTMTFIYREIMALRAQGMPVKVYSTWRPDPQKLSPESRALMADTFYLFPLDWLQFLWAHLYFIVSRPLRYLGTFWGVLRASDEQPRRLALHFAEAVPLAWVMQRQGVRHIHGAFASNPANLAFIISQLTGLPFSFAAHAHDIFVERGLLRQKLLAAQFVIASTHYNKRFLAEHFPGAAVEKIHVVYHGVSLRNFQPAPRPDNPLPTILCVAQFREKKGLPILIEACRLLHDQGERFLCLIVGDGPQRTLLQNLIADYGLGECVRLEVIVFQDRIQDYYRRADVVTLPAIVAADGDRDGIPVTLIEVQAMGCPVVSTTVSGIPEVVEAGHTGLLVPPGDAPALAEALRTLMRDRALGQTMGQAGRVRMTQLFDIEANSKNLASLFTEYVCQPCPRQLNDAQSKWQ